MSEPCTGAPLLTAGAIGYRYGSYQALDDVTFRIAAGELVALLRTMMRHDLELIAWLRWRDIRGAALAARPRHHS